MESLGVVCAEFDLYLATEAVRICVLLKMIDMLPFQPHDSIPALLHRPTSKQLLCWLMFYGNGSACVWACKAAHRVCIARSEVKVPLARVWILLS